MAFVSETATDPQELRVSRTGLNSNQIVTHFNREIKDLHLIQPELFKYASFDGTEIEAALLKPASFNEGTPLPLVVLIHGGPSGRWADSFEPWGQMLASRGTCVLYPNIRGSTGYGWRFLEMNRGDWGGADFRDVMAGVDFLIEKGVANPERLGIGGWSYGGYMASWAITQTPRFKAAVTGAGMSNLMSEFGTEERDTNAYDAWFNGLPYEYIERYLKSSPVTYMKNARTPTLILQGENDSTDPIGQSQELYRALRHYGVETEMVLYPREEHGFREEKHILDMQHRILEWFHKHL